MILSKVNTLTLTDPDYPSSLTRLDQPPTQLFYSGTAFPDWLNMPRVAVVGSRKASPYGSAVTTAICKQLSEQGVVIVSGLAYGIDSVAHRAALEAGGITVAVLPTPLDRIYPAVHFSLAQQILRAGGALISEYPPKAEIYKINFIARNRIVSALADVLLITEATAGSGTLHTARFALEQGKTVMAVPGNINQPGSEGCNNLIKSGAVPVTDSSDVLFALGLPSMSNHRLDRFKPDGTQKAILELIGSGVADVEELALTSQLDSAQLGSTLTTLEIAGVIRPEGGGRWTLA